MENSGDLTIWLSLVIDFECEVSFDDFQKWYKEEKDMIPNKNVNIVFDYEKMYKEEEKIMSIMKSFWEFQYIDSGNKTISMDIFDYLIYKICRWCAWWWLGMQNIQRIWDLLKYDIIERFFYKQSDGRIAILALKKDTDIRERWDFECLSGFIRYRNAKSSWWIRKEHEEAYKFILGVAKNNKQVKSFVKMLQKVHYRREIKENGKLQYLIYCSLFLQKELYLVFYEWMYPEKVWIVDKENIDWYLKRWVLAVEISDLFFSIYANLYRKSDLFENLKTKRDRQKLWGLLLRDLKTTSKNKKKLTVNIDISNDAPDFMSAKWKVRDNPSNVNFYEQLKEEVGEHWEIARMVSEWKWDTLKVKKRFLYDKKGWKKDAKK